MKKFYLLFVLCILKFSSSFSQCKSCPDFLNIDDGYCLHADIGSNFNTVGLQQFGNTDTTAFEVCKESFHTYCLDALPTNSAQGPCLFPDPIIDSIVATGGTILDIGVNCFDVQWGNTNYGLITVYFHIPNDQGAICRSVAVLYFDLVDNPIANFVASPQPACFSSPTAIHFNSNASVAATTYLWSFGDGTTGVGPNPTHNYTASGTYNVCLYVTNIIPSLFGQPTDPCPGCVDTFCSNITIQTLPPPDITCITTVCAGAKKKYCTSAAGCSSYNWSVIGGVITNGAGTNCITVQWGSGNPQGTINLTVNGCSSAYCSIGNSVQVPIIPTNTAILGDTIVCIGNTASYALPSWPGTNYAWSISGGGGNFVNNNTNTSTIDITWPTAGTYTITCAFNNTGLQCGGIGTTIVKVLPHLKIGGVNTVCQATTLPYNAYYNSPSYTPVASFWSIYPNSGATVTSGQNTANPTINWITPGSYTLTAVATSSLIVCDSASFVVIVNPNPIISDIVGSNNICANATNNYYAISNINASNFAWSVTGGSYFTTGINNDSVVVTWNPAGPYNIAVQQTLGSGCVSNIYNENYTTGTIPTLAGPTNVCVDATTNYTITNMTIGNFNWYITPAQFGTIQSGQGSNTVSILWYGNNNPGGTNTVYLHYGLCGTDSIAIAISDPTALVITQTGTACAGAGITLSASVGSGTILWSCLEHPIIPTQTLSNSSIININTAGTYIINVNNYNNTGCNAVGTKTIGSSALPTAIMSPTGVQNYCLTNLPNFTASAVTGAGYSYQWFRNGTSVGTGTSLAINSGAPCNINALGSYVIYLVVTKGGCADTSKLLTINVQNCSGSPGTFTTCPGGSLTVNTKTGCNPFAFTITLTGPIGSTPLLGTETITHYDDGSIVSGLTTKTYYSIGTKNIKICKNFLLSDGITVCSACRDTSVNVEIAAGFVEATYVCGVETFTNLSTVSAPATIVSYAWSIGDYPTNNPVPPLIASFNNPALATPVLTVNVSDTFILTLTVTSSNGCTSTITRNGIYYLPNASFATVNSCVGTPINFTAAYPGAYNSWDFGDASSSYINPTQHTYVVPGTYAVTHITNAPVVPGCLDTVTNLITIIAAPTCNIGYIGATTFCQFDSLTLNACAGNTNYQWYKNGVAILGEVNTVYQAKTSGNYNFTATDPGGCILFSDTISVTVNPRPAATLTMSGVPCVGSVVDFIVPSCAGCNYFWKINNVTIINNSNILTKTAGLPPLGVGPHWIKVLIQNTYGCTSNDSILIIVNPLPTVTISVVGSPAMLCSNNQYQLVATTNSTNPSWNWKYQLFSISNNDSLMVSADGTYSVTITDTLTKCSNSATQVVFASPNLELFPIGCDSLCDSLGINMPVANINNSLLGYSIDWYNNAPPFMPSIGTGFTLPLNTIGLGNHQLSVIVTAPNGCMDTSTVYSLFVKACYPIPLNINSVVLNGSKNGATVNLNWQTINKKYTNYYQLEQSTDGVNFETIQTVEHNNIAEDLENNYIDAIMPQSNIVFYKLKLITVSGQTITSNLLQFTNTLSNTDLMYALPTLVNNECNIYLETKINQTAELKIYNSTGRLITQKQLALNKSLNEFKIDCSTLSSGIYLINVRTQEGILNSKIIKK
jgi:PKD repeat protein